MTGAVGRRSERHVEQPLQTKDYAYLRLRQDIVTSEFPPGMAIREAMLVERYGVSKTPIREALVRLEKEGLVEVVKYRGARVMGYSARDVREIYEMRELLQGFCARLAARDISQSDEAELEHNIRRSRELLASDRIPALVEAFEQFDELLYRQASGHRANSAIHDLTAHLERLGALTVGVPGRLEHSVEQHSMIAAAIHRRDAEEAEATCRAHIRSVLDDVMQQIHTSGFIS